eukprot:3754858-Lingulodinium_polyedra.AAC.1
MKPGLRRRPRSWHSAQASPHRRRVPGAAGPCTAAAASWSLPRGPPVRWACHGRRGRLRRRFRRRATAGPAAAADPAAWLGCRPRPVAARSVPLGQTPAGRGAVAAHAGMGRQQGL